MLDGSVLHSSIPTDVWGREIKNNNKINTHTLRFTVWDDMKVSGIF